jgi:small subunit ribosomal protein SAe
MANLTSEHKDILRLLSSNCHIGTKNLCHQMKPYVESKTNEGIHLINPKTILEKIKLAARVIVAVQNPEDVIVSQFFIF